VQAEANHPAIDTLQRTLLYHYCRLRLPTLAVPFGLFEKHLERSLRLYQVRRGKDSQPASWEHFLANLHAVDWFVSCSCLDRDRAAWDYLFAMKASRADCLLVDALRARAVRLYPRNEERQDSAVAEFWGYLLAGERDGSPPILARYDGQRPLVPWLIRVFQNRHISELRRAHGLQTLPEEELDARDLSLPGNGDDRWHDEFRLAAREWLGTLRENEMLILGLRLRYRLSQRQVAGLLGVHEGNISRQTTKLRDHCLEEISQKLLEQGWTGDDLSGFILKEMDSLLMDEPRLSADHLASLLAARGKSLTPPPEES
jgi:RNA polymerase sigma factor (sigma-70 family)